MSDKTEYEKAREEKICELKCLYAFPDDIFTSCCGLPTALDILRKFDIAEGERREREKERPKDVYSEGLTVGMGLGRQQALKEVEEQIEYFIGEWLKECPNDRRNGALSGAKKLKQAIDQLRKEEK